MEGYQHRDSEVTESNVNQKKWEQNYIQGMKQQVNV